MKKVFIILAAVTLVLSATFFTMHILEEDELSKEQEVIDDIFDEIVIENTTKQPNDKETQGTEPTNPSSTEPTYPEHDLPIISETKPSEGGGTETTQPKPPTNPNPAPKVPVAIDIDALKKKNEDATAWICIENSNVSYPIMSSDGNEYLNKNIYGETTKVGSIFSYSNQKYTSPENIDKNVVLYGHNLRTGTMFSYLNTMYADIGYLKNKTNEYIYVYTEECILKYKIYALYRIDKDENFTQVYFKDDTDFIEFCNTTYNRSKYKDFKPNFNEESTILTLVTCPRQNSKDYRMVLHAVLIDTAENNY